MAPDVAVTSAQVDDMPSTTDALGTSQRLAIAGAGIFTAASGVMAAASAPDVARFIVSACALAFLAALVGESIEQIGERLGPGPTGLLQSSIGNLPELLVAIFALRSGLTTVVQAALVGSVLGTLLLVLGAAFLSGGARHGDQLFRPEAPRMLVTLLTLAVGAALVPTLAARLDTPAVHHTAALSDVTAVVLLLVYAASIPFWLRGGPDQFKTEWGDERAPERRWSGPGALGQRPLTRFTHATDRWVLVAPQGDRRAGSRRRRVGICLGLVRFVPGPRDPLPRHLARLHRPGDRGNRLERRRERGRYPLRLESQTGSCR